MKRRVLSLLSSVSMFVVTGMLGILSDHECVSVNLTLRAEEIAPASKMYIVVNTIIPDSYIVKRPGQGDAISSNWIQITLQEAPIENSPAPSAP